MKENVKYYEEMGIDYENSGSLLIVNCIDGIERFVKSIISLFKWNGIFERGSPKIIGLFFFFFHDRIRTRNLHVVLWRDR